MHTAMPCDIPHRQTILHLIPRSSQAEDALSHPDNAPFVSLSTRLTTDSSSIEQELGLEIGYHVPVRPCPEVVVEVGRNADLVLPGPSMSKVQFSFEVHPESKEIMFHDRSRYHSTRIDPDGFRLDGNFRQIVLRPGVEYCISAGGEKKNLYMFDLWWVTKEGAVEENERGYQMADERAQNPRWARTVDDGPTELPSWYNTRLHTPSGGGVQRTSKGKDLGKGSFGVVKKAVDLDSGRFVAVKEVELPPKVNGLPSEQEKRIYREVKILSSLSHKHIIEYLGSSSLQEGTLSIYMSLRAGNLNDLLGRFPHARRNENFLHRLLKQMLEALDYLAYRDLFHRDVKPDNILYTVVNDHECIFQLADFGLANQQALAKTQQIGTPMFTAPEIYFHGHPQTSKMDIWSLFVTLASVTRAAGFDEDKLENYRQVLDVVKKAAVTELSALSAMAREDPTLRASAAQMLVQYFGGDGLTTPRRRIGSVPDSGEEMGHIQVRGREKPGLKEPGFKTKVPMGTAGIRTRVSQARSPKVLAKDASKV
ncbi:MAG: hypothetical protein Q9196_006237, partial [Gyalolechia fulgens]